MNTFFKEMSEQIINTNTKYKCIKYVASVKLSESVTFTYALSHVIMSYSYYKKHTLFLCHVMRFWDNFSSCSISELHLNAPWNARRIVNATRPLIGRRTANSTACVSKSTNQLAFCWLVRRSVFFYSCGKGEAKRLAKTTAASAVRCGAMDLRDNVETGETEKHTELFYVPIPEEEPCKREQEKLSGVVKNVHRKLRRKYREGKQQLQGPSVSAWPCSRGTNTEP